jgi:uncharacterized membrane protein
MALLGYLGTLLILIAWYAWLAPSTQLPLALTLLVAAPLLLPLKGMLLGQIYTHRWGLFLAVAYFAHGVVEAYALPQERNYALVEIVTSLLWFAGAIAYVRCRRPREGGNGSGPYT